MQLIGKMKMTKKCLNQCHRRIHFQNINRVQLYTKEHRKLSRISVLLTNVAILRFIPKKISCQEKRSGRSSLTVHTVYSGKSSSKLDLESSRSGSSDLRELERRTTQLRTCFVWPESSLLMRKKDHGSLTICPSSFVRETKRSEISNPI